MKDSSDRKWLIALAIIASIVLIFIIVLSECNDDAEANTEISVDEIEINFNEINYEIKMLIYYPDNYKSTEIELVMC